MIENIKELSSEKTCIIISNKVSDVKYSDKIIVLDKGNIVEEGTHEQLIQNEGIYSGFYNQQSTKAEPIFWYNIIVKEKQMKNKTLQRVYKMLKPTQRQ